MTCKAGGFLFQFVNTQILRSKASEERIPQVKLL